MYKYMSGMKNLIHFARMSKKEFTLEQIYDVVKKVNLESSIHKKVKTYSLGMRQRLGIAQVILHNPSLLILDEPPNGLDPKGILELRSYLKSFKNEGKSIIISSHLLSEMQLICDRAAIIEEGKLVDVISLKDKKFSSQKEFDVSNSHYAARILRNNSYNVEIISKSKIRVSTMKEEIPIIIDILIRNNIKVYYIKESEVLLENHFLNLTKAEGQ